jgi:hypothetical protein
MTDRKRPTVGFWITVALVAVLVGYPLSFGPACWLTDRDYLPERLFKEIYRPMATCFVRLGMIRIASWYGELLPTPKLPPNLSGFGHGNFRISTARFFVLSVAWEE